MWFRVLILLILLTNRSWGQADIRYDVQDGVKTADLDYTIEHGCTVYSWTPPSDLQYSIQITIWGCKKKSYTYESQWYETALTPRQYDELESIVKKVEVSKLTRGQTTCYDGMLAIDGVYHYFNNPLSDPVRDHLHKAILAYMEKLAPMEKRKITRFTIEGDFEPARPVTIAQLLADPAKYDGKRIRATGYYHREDYESEFSQRQGEDFDHTIWLDDASSFANLADIHWTDDGHVTVEGTFVKGPGGRWGAYPGEIARLTKMICLDPPRPPPPPADQNSKR